MLIAHPVLILLLAILGHGLSPKNVEDAKQKLLGLRVKGSPKIQRSPRVSKQALVEIGDSEMVETSPLHYVQHEEPPTSYNFEYQIHGGGNHFGHAETKSAFGTSGYYHVLLPNGLRQVVTYYVDGEGYHPTITYEPVFSQAASPSQEEAIINRNEIVEHEEPGPIEIHQPIEIQKSIEIQNPIISSESISFPSPSSDPTPQILIFPRSNPDYGRIGVKQKKNKTPRIVKKVRNKKRIKEEKLKRANIEEEKVQNADNPKVEEMAKE